MKIVTVGRLGGKPDGKASRFMADKLALAMRLGLEPEPVPDTRIQRFSATLPDPVAGALEVRAKESGVSPAVLAARWVRAAELYEEQDAGLENTGAVVIIGEAEVRPILRPALHEAWQAMQDGKLAFVEASTGTGKGRWIAAQALTAAVAQQVVVIAAPLVVARQLIHEIHHLDATARPHLLFGRSNFADPDKLEAWLESIGDAEGYQLRQWCAAGGQPATVESRKLNEIVGGKLAWLMDDVAALADEDAPLSGMVLNDDADEANPAEVVYQNLREQVAVTGCGIIICSHTMLAADCRLASMSQAAALLPEKIDMLLVDEAQELERAWATVHSQQLHLMPLARHAREAGIRAARDLHAITQANDALCEAIRRYGNKLPVTGTLSTMPEIEEAAKALHRALEAIPGQRKKTTQACPARKALSFARDTLTNLLSGRSTIQLAVSPIRHHPMVTVGRANLESSFAALWDRVRGGSLVSATLYLPEANGTYSAAHARWVMAIPKARAYYLLPVAPEWVMNTAVRKSLPGSILPDDSPEWLEQTAAQALTVYEQARGGVLVLCTSYGTVEALAALLAGRLPSTACIAQSSNQNAAACARQFIRLATSGIRPIWLGVGSAWAGVDLTDKTVPTERAHEDLVLTDLLIPRLPFGVNRTLTHQRRVKALGFMVEVYEMVRALKQGIGRLVRREGVRHRKLWITDVRLSSEAHQKASYVTMVRKLLSKYQSA